MAAQGRGGRGGQDGTGFGAQDAAAGVGEGGQEAWVVLAQVGAELVVGGGAVPNGVLLGAGQHCDGLGQLGSAGSGRCACMSVRSTLASTNGVAVVGFQQATECRSR